MVLFVVLSFPCVNPAAADELVAYVSDGGSAWTNWDLYLENITTSTITRLTTNAAIDNHPELSPDKLWVVFSSNRAASGEFDIYLGDVADVEGTLRQLTDDSYPNGPQTQYPDRHPHFHSNGKLIIFTSKNQPLTHPIEIASECSVPIIIVPPRYYEKMNIIEVDGTGTFVSYTELDIRDAWDSATYPTIWVDNNATYAGHPSFSHDGTKIVFSGSIDGAGKVWEIYSVGFNPVTIELVPLSLRRHTYGPEIGANPIQMSGGAHFSEDDSTILFSSTRTPAGNSQIFSVPVTGLDIPVTSATQLTNHPGNDYVPEPLDDVRFLVASDLGSPGICWAGEGPTADLDIVLVDGDDREILGTESYDEMLLIGDEVSWFCGLKPNLSVCNYQPRIMNVEALWLENTAWAYVNGHALDTPIPEDLLAGFGYPNQARDIYSTGWENMNNYMSVHGPATWEDVLSCVTLLDVSGYPGLGDPGQLQNWMQTNATLRKTKHVVSSIMYAGGIGPEPEVLPPWIYDYNGDGTSDIAIFRESSGLWAVRGVTRAYFGTAGDQPVSGDYNGNGTTGIGIYRPSSGLWALRGVSRIYFGNDSDILVPGDFDGDAIDDVGIFRPSSGLWAIRGVTRAYFGTTGDTPVPGYYDGIITKDIGIFRRSSGLWALRNISRVYFGASGDETVPGDYDGNGTWSVGIFRPSLGLWAIRGVTRAYYGMNSDDPVPGDYDGDGVDDIGIFRPTIGLWAVRKAMRSYFGTSGDIPVTR